MWVLARYAATKRLNEHLRTPHQSRVNRTWLILSRKICEGKLPRVRSYFSSPSSFSLLLFFIMPPQTRTPRSATRPLPSLSLFHFLRNCQPRKDRGLIRCLRFKFLLSPSHSLKNIYIYIRIYASVLDDIVNFPREKITISSISSE